MTLPWLQLTCTSNPPYKPGRPCLFFRANVKVLIDFCAYGTAKRKTLVIIVKFYENILLEKRHVRVQRKYFFKTFSEIKHYVIVNDIEGLTTTFKKT